jgi:hypothetical protein
MLRNTIVCSFAWISLATIVQAGERIRILPGDLVLDGTAARHRLLIERVNDKNQLIGPIVEGVAIESSDSAVVKVEDGVLVPAANGQATITAKQGDQSANIKVIVKNADRPLAMVVPQSRAIGLEQVGLQ